MTVISNAHTHAHTHRAITQHGQAPSRRVGLQWDRQGAVITVKIDGNNYTHKHTVRYKCSVGVSHQEKNKIQTFSTNFIQ